MGQGRSLYAVRKQHKGLEVEENEGLSFLESKIAVETVGRQVCIRELEEAAECGQPGYVAVWWTARASRSCRCPAGRLWMSVNVSQLCCPGL